MIALDTHAWVWWLTKPEKLGKKAARSIQRADRIGVPAICVWEVAMKAHAGKLKFDRPSAAWIDQALAEDSRVTLLPLSPRIAITAVELEWAHQDPSDRLIVASAQVHDCPLVTLDERIASSGLLRCVWD